MAGNKHPRILAAAALLALAALGLARCENTPLTGPEDGELRLSASPLTVVIDPEAGETSGTSTLAAQLFDGASRPMVDAEVVFATSAGSLASGGAPHTVKTNSSGIAVDVLTLGVDDGSSVKVNAISGKLSAEETITLQVNPDNVPPTADISIDPPNKQRLNELVVFDGTGSSDPDSDITCYQWQINSTVVAQGPTASTFSDDFSTAQRLTVTLRVSDDPNAPTTFCRSGGNAPTAPPEDFNGTAFTRYDIVCDINAPVASIAGSSTLLLQGPSVTQTFSGSASDPDAGDTIVRFVWDCGNGQTMTGSPPLPTMTCNYAISGGTATTFIATLSVTNNCGLTGEDTVNVTVRP